MIEPASLKEIEQGIFLIRGHRVMLDSDLAAIYGVATRRLNEQLRRNIKRFPDDFAFQISREEFANLKSQFATSSSHGGRRNSLRSQFATSKARGGRRYLPWVFTEHGALMLASVLNSEIAIAASVRVVRAFVRLREMIAANSELSRRLDEIERKLDTHDAAVAQLFDVLRQLLAPPPAKKREIGFHVRERATRYRIAKSKIENRNSKIF